MVPKVDSRKPTTAGGDDEVTINGTVTNSGDTAAVNTGEGNDTVTVYNADANGKLTVREAEPVRGSWPRNINLSPDANYLPALQFFFAFSLAA